MKLPVDELKEIRGAKIGMVFQDPMTSLHPFYKVGDQISEAILAHEKVSDKEAFGKSRRDAQAGGHPEAGGAAPSSTRTSSPAGCGNAP